MLRTASFLLSCILTAFPAKAGTLKMVYTNDAGVSTYSPSAAISNANAAKVIAWCQSRFVNFPAASTPGGCFNLYANDIFAQLKVNVDAFSGQTAAASAPTVTITPNQ